MGIPDKEDVLNQERPAARVTVVDADELDSEIERIFKEKLLKIVYDFSPSLGKWEPELEALLRLIVWKLSVSRLKSTFGQELLSIKYSREVTSRRAAAWAVLSIGSRYLKQRSSEFTRWIFPTQYQDQVKQVTNWIELLVLVGTMVNFLQFLREGLYPNLADRLCSMKPISTAPTTTRVMGYHFMTRQLLWHGFTEFLVFILPLVNYKYLERNGRKLLGLQRKKLNRQETLVYTIATRCAVCRQPPVLPHHMGCAHAFCYYCIQSNQLVDPKFECPDCGYSTDNPESVKPVVASLSYT